MNGILNFLWEGSVCLLLLYAFYRILLAKLTFFNWNRVYLMLSVIIVLTIPLLSFQIDTSPEPNPVTGSLMYFFPDHIHQSPEIPSTKVPIGIQILFWIYFAGFTLSVLRLMIGLKHILGRIKSSENHNHQGHILLIQPDFKPSSFFHYIFLPEYLPGNKEQLLIISHEQLHSRFLHTIDCLVFQMFRCVFWFHPIIKLMENSLYEIHEYQVDSEMTKFHSKTDYSQLLVHLIWTGGGRLVNNFNQFQIKNRIMMMAQTKSTTKEKFKFLLTLPLMGLLIVIFSCEQQEQVSPAPPPPPMEVFDVVDKMPKPMGGLEAWSQYLASNLTYPSKAKEKGISGTVYLTFIVDTEGSIQRVELFRGVEASLDEEAIKVVENAPKWEPGTQSGRPVNVKMRLPIHFSLNSTAPGQHSTLIGNINGAESGALKVDANYADGVWSGVVRDAQGNVLPGATIVNGATSVGTVSDINGRFSIESSRSGDLHASLAGYKSVRLQ